MVANPTRGACYFTVSASSMSVMIRFPRDEPTKPVACVRENFVVVAATHLGVHLIGARVRAEEDHVRAEPFESEEGIRDALNTRSGVLRKRREKRPGSAWR